MEEDDRLLIIGTCTVNGLARDFLSLALQQLLITKGAAIVALVASLAKR